MVWFFMNPATGEYCAIVDEEVSSNFMRIGNELDGSRADSDKASGNALDGHAAGSLLGGPAMIVARF
jgi:hypothetical protein